MTPLQRHVLNLADSLSFYGRAERRDGMMLVTAPVRYSVFNITVLLDAIADDSELETKAGIAARHYESIGHPWSIWICDDLLPKRVLRRVHDTLGGIGLGCIADPPGMELPDFPTMRHALPRMDFRLVGDASTRADFASLTTECFQIPAEIATTTYGNAEAWEHPMRMWLGYCDGVAVTSAATMNSHGAVGIYSVGTRYQYRRQGYGEAVMRHAVSMARREGNTGPLLLQSSPIGLPLYRNLGFKRITRFSVFATHVTLA